MALELPNREILYATLEEHGVFRAMNFGLLYGEILDVTQHRRWIPGCVITRALSSLGAACAGIPAAARDPWVRACACSL